MIISQTIPPRTGGDRSGRGTIRFFGQLYSKNRITIREPKSQKKKFAPEIGFDYAPDFDSGMLGALFGASGKTSIRGGFSMAYDYIFDNLYILSLPPQAQQTRDCPQDCPNQPFLAQGGISPIATGGLTDPATARAATSSFIPDQEVPYSLSRTGSFQRQFMQNWALELRHLGTRGIHLLTQGRLNIQARVSPEEGRRGLPTFFSAPSQAQLDALSLTLAQIDARPVILPSYAAAGFTAPITAFLSNGTEGVGSTVTALTRTDGQIVGYLVNNPNARYIQTGNGAESTIGRNTFQGEPINNLDFSIFKNFRFGETKFFQPRADMFNALNHAQHIPGSVNTVDPIATTGVTTCNQVAPLTPDFLRSERVFSGNPRVIRLGARFNF